MDRETIVWRLTEAVAQTLEVSPEQVDRCVSFDAQGLDSMGKVSLVSQLEQIFSCTLDNEALFDFANIDCLADHVASLIGANGDSLSCPPEQSAQLAVSGDVEQSHGSKAIVGR